MSFTLPDFLKSNLFNTLRFQMNAPLVEHFGAQLPISEIALPLLERLQKTGIDVSADQIERLEDDTLAYQGYRVLVYIRDIQAMGQRDDMPRYHLAYCRTLETMYRNKRSERYVVANADTGLFQVNIIEGSVRAEFVRLNVCQNCLDALSWQGFGMQMPRPTRLAAVKHFKLADFFHKYPRDLISVQPKHCAMTAPLNTYSDDWKEISERSRRQRGYQCTKCHTILSQADSEFLHVHHRNGQKHDNRDENLDVLCIECHANEPMHSHMKHLLAYQTFVQRYRR